MSAQMFNPWTENVGLHPEVFSGEFSEDIFTRDRGPLF